MKVLSFPFCTLAKMCNCMYLKTQAMANYWIWHVCFCQATSDVWSQCRDAGPTFGPRLLGSLAQSLVGDFFLLQGRFSDANWAAPHPGKCQPVSQWEEGGIAGAGMLTCASSAGVGGGGLNGSISVCPATPTSSDGWRSFGHIPFSLNLLEEFCTWKQKPRWVCVFVCSIGYFMHTPTDLRTHIYRYRSAYFCTCLQRWFMDNLESFFSTFYI